MTGRPTPETRYQDERLQADYQTGWRQMYDHDSLSVVDWVDAAVHGALGEADRCRRRAAMLEGCADALLELADRQHEGAAMWAGVDGSDAA